MQPEAGARTDAPTFVVLLTDGKSQDDAIAAANQLKAAGVEIIAVGETLLKSGSLYTSNNRMVWFLVCWMQSSTLLWFSSNYLGLESKVLSSGIKNADEAELRQLASEPVDLNVYNVSDFPLLSKVVTRLVHMLCGRIEEHSRSKRKLSPQKAILLSSVLNGIVHLLQFDCSDLVGVSPVMEPGPRPDPTLSSLSPTELRFSDLGSSGVRLSWTSPPQPVRQYRLVYHSAEGQNPQEVSSTTFPCNCC